RGQVGQRRLKNQFDLIGQQQAFTRCHLGHDAELQQRIVRSLAPVALKALQNHTLAFAALLEAVGSAASGLFVEAVWEVARVLWRNDRQFGGRQLVQEQPRRVLEGDAQRQRVDGDDAVDQVGVEGRAQWNPKLGIEEALQ